MPNHVYIHIPFCTNKCYYCDFNVFVWQGDDWVWQYLKALENEMKLTVEQAPAIDIKTIYVGGGTPTILNDEQMEYFLSLIQTYFPEFMQKEGREFTFEANPGTLSLEKLRLMKSGGVNRLSIGVQSFDDQLLKQLGRIHTAKEAIHAVEIAREAGFANLTIDLMLGLPNQTLEHIKESLKVVKDLQVEHLSAYGLKVEEQTVFHRWLREGKLPLPPEETEVEMYLSLIDGLAKIGLVQYEVSNFAKLGYESQHNLAYWNNREYYGLGAGAHGYVHGIRHENIGPLRPYIRAASTGLPRADHFPVSDQERMEEMMFMGLRLVSGITFERFQSEWGIPMQEVYGEEIESLQNRGLLVVDHLGIRLSRKGMLVGNEVFASFLK